EFFPKLSALLNLDSYTQAAQAFAKRYADYSPKRQAEKLVERVEEILARPAARYERPAARSNVVPFPKILSWSAPSLPKEKPAMNPKVDLAAALALHQKGRFKQAERMYREILIQNPNHVDALHLLGVLVYQMG